MSRCATMVLRRSTRFLDSSDEDDSECDTPNAIPFPKPSGDSEDTITHKRMYPRVMEDPQSVQFIFMKAATLNVEILSVYIGLRIIGLFVLNSRFASLMRTSSGSNAGYVGSGSTTNVWTKTWRSLIFHWNGSVQNANFRNPVGPNLVKICVLDLLFSCFSRKNLTHVGYHSFKHIKSSIFEIFSNL